MTTRIWGRYEGRAPEVIDTVAPGAAARLLGEYRLAFGAGWTLWLGRRDDEPRPRRCPEGECLCVVKGARAVCRICGDVKRRAS